MSISINLLVLLSTTLHHIIASWLENKSYPPLGKLIDINGYKMHLYTLGNGSPTVILDSSLGGIEGYFLVEKIAQITQVCIYDRAGYGWSDYNPHRRCSQQIVKELDLLLNSAGIAPPYILVGDSFGSYNVRLYANQFPEKVVGMVLTDGLHEEAMLRLPVSLQLLKLLFMSGFAMSTLGSTLGIVRLLGTVGMFEFLKPELRKFHPKTLHRVKSSFYRHQHWITMWREMWNLDISANQVRQANNFGDIPLVSIKASTFFNRSIWNFYMPVKAADALRETMHAELLKLSTKCSQLPATHSGHFIWIDEPEVILAAIREVWQKLTPE